MIEVEQDRQVRSTGGKRVVEFRVDEEVWAKDFSKNAPQWVKGKIIKRLGPVTYEVELNAGHIVKRHVDQLFKGPKPAYNATQNEKTQEVYDKVPLRRSERLREKAIRKITFKLLSGKIVKPV